jgi:lysophospholipase L1-like esterase
MLGINAEGQFVATGERQIETRYVAGIERRARIAGRHGGFCVVVPHAPDPRPRAAQQLFEALARKAAKAGGCRFAPVLAGLWDGERSASLGLTADGLHPTPRGYRRMAGRLARLILSLARVRP